MTVNNNSVSSSDQAGKLKNIELLFSFSFFPLVYNQRTKKKALKFDEQSLAMWHIFSLVESGGCSERKGPSAS